MTADCLGSTDGGGYQYRLCSADEPLTEECFMRTPLDFNRAAHRCVTFHVFNVAKIFCLDTLSTACCILQLNCVLILLAFCSLIYNNGSLISYIKGTFVTEGVKPAGSTWARNPIPRSATDNTGMSPENW